MASGHRFWQILVGFSILTLLLAACVRPLPTVGDLIGGAEPTVAAGTAAEVSESSAAEAGVADSVADAAYPAPAEALADSAAEAYPVEEAVGETGGEIPAEDVAEEEDIDHAEPEGEASDAPAGPIDIAVAPADDESEAGTTDDGAAADTSAETGDAAAGAYPAEEPAPTEPVPAEPEPETPAAEPIIHTVAPGETLFRIGLKYGVAWTEIAQANGITDPNRITAGQQLVIPGTEATPSAPGQGSTHVVQPGQTLASIAQQYGVSWPDLAAANNIGWPYTIYAGQTLIIPGS